MAAGLLGVAVIAVLDMPANRPPRTAGRPHAVPGEDDDVVAVQVQKASVGCVGKRTH